MAAAKTLGETVSAVLRSPNIKMEVEALIVAIERGAEDASPAALTAHLVALVTSAALAGFSAGQLAERNRMLMEFELAVPSSNGGKRGH